MEHERGDLHEPLSREAAAKAASYSITAPGDQMVTNSEGEEEMEKADFEASDEESDAESAQRPGESAEVPSGSHDAPRVAAEDALRDGAGRERAQSRIDGASGSGHEAGPESGSSASVPRRASSLEAWEAANRAALDRLKQQVRDSLPELAVSPMTLEGGGEATKRGRGSNKQRRARFLQTWPVL